MSTSLRRGFTLIELLIVVVIISILATVAIPRLTQTKGRAVTANMKSDLRNMIMAQESYYFQHSDYTANMALLPVHASANITLTIVSADGAGFSASATSPIGSYQTCAVYLGAPPSIAPPATEEGKIACQ